MDTAAVDRQGFAPLDSEFARIAAVKDLPALASAVARLQHIGVGALYGLYIDQDEKNSDRYAVHLYQGGLGLPDRDYYFDTDARTTMLRREYVAHVARMFRLLGDDSMHRDRARDHGDGDRDRARRRVAQARGPARPDQELQRDGARRRSAS